MIEGRSLSRVLGPVLVLLTPALLGAACPHKPDDCEHDSIERCNWEQAIDAQADTSSPSEGAGQDSGNSGDEFGESAVGSTRGDLTNLDATVLSMIDIMGAGLEWTLVDTRARELCRVRNDEGELVQTAVEITQTSGDGGDEAQTAQVWRCHLEWLEINGQSLDLEASNGVISLSAGDLDLSSSEELASFARTRFDDRCAGRFEFYEGARLDEFHRCALPEGPYLVVARFPSDPAADPEAMRWQVSIAVVDAG